MENLLTSIKGEKHISLWDRDNAEFSALLQPIDDWPVISHILFRYPNVQLDILSNHYDIIEEYCQAVHPTAKLVKAAVPPESVIDFSVVNIEGASTLGMPKLIKECTYRVNDKCIKVFADSEVCINRIRRNHQLAGLVPELIYKGKHVYSYKWVKGDTLYAVDDCEVFKKFYTWCVDNLWVQSEDDDFFLECYSFYHKKTKERIAKYMSMYKNHKGPFNIRGKICKDVYYYLGRINWQNLTEGIPSQFHGDLQFDNVVFDGKTFTLIDWRDSFANSTTRGDLWYDLGKMYAGTTMSFSLLKQDKFYVDVDPTNRQVVYDFSNTVNLEAYGEHFLRGRSSEEVEKLETLRALIYLNMAPLHPEPLSHLLFFHGVYLLAELYR
jgi:thiamine kinase-like enzyme